MEDIRVLIGTPAYNSMVHLDYLATILNLHQVGLRFVHFGAGNDSLVTRPRNTIITLFYKMKDDFSHLFMLDGDVGMAGKDLVRLLSHEKDVIAAPVELKADPNGRPIWNYGLVIRKENGLLVVPKAGTAVMLLSKKAVIALIEDAIEDDRSYTPNVLAGGCDIGLEIGYDVFQVGVIDGEYKSEDFWVCHSLRRLGFEVYVDPEIKTSHHGMASFGDHG